MKNKKKSIIYSVLLIVLVLVFSYLYAHIDKNIYLYDRHADTSTFQSTGVLKENEEITQTFTSKEEAIDGISLKVSIVGNVEDVILHYAIVDVETGKVVKNSIAATKLSNNKFNELEVPQITKAQGKEYKLVLSVENSDEQNGITFYKIQDERLVARIICHKFDVETFVVAAGIILFIYGFMKILYKSFR